MARNFRNRRIGDHELHPDTLMVSYGYDPALSEGAVKPPIFLTSTFEFATAQAGAASFAAQGTGSEEAQAPDSGLIYSRFNHPNAQIAEERLAVIADGDDAAVFASGMAAISSALLALARPGDSILHSQPLYGGTETLMHSALADLGFNAIGFCDGLDEATVMKAAKRALACGPVRIIFIETPANPTNALIDFRIVERCVSHLEKTSGVRPITICDNTMLGPVFQRPLQNGIDVDVYSLTKYVGGHSDLVAGAAIGAAKYIGEIRRMRSALGNHLDPHSCWMISRSLETVSLRMNRTCETASSIAHWLSEQPQVTTVWHPELLASGRYKEVYLRQCHGPGSTFSFTLTGGRDAAYCFLNSLQLFKLAVSLGGTESLASHPATMTHAGIPADVREAVGIGPGLIRISIGLEHAGDLITDIRQALARLN